VFIAPPKRNILGATEKTGESGGVKAVLRSLHCEKSVSTLKLCSKNLILLRLVSFVKHFHTLTF